MKSAPIQYARLHLPLILLLTINLIAGLLTFRDFGFSWDEPLFYEYGDALPYAYSIPARLGGNFDLERAFGSSPDDHKTRGPAWLILAGPLSRGLQSAGLDEASAWHLVNFLSFEFGLFCLYLLCRRWVERWAAAAGTALFAWQPVLWGHAFINPKDIPFMAFFTASLVTGLHMADQLASPAPAHPRRVLGWTVLPAILVGLATSIRVLGPLAAVLVAAYYLSLGNLKRWQALLPYAGTAVLAMFATWPYLWQEPVTNFLSVFAFMSDNPTELAVLFMGQTWPAGDVPLRYLPTLLGLTLSEPVWPLAALGLLAAFLSKKRTDWRGLLAVLAVPVILAAYVLLRRPALYDGYRHFLFILPPVFVLAAIFFQFVYDRITRNWINIALTAAILLPGIAGIALLHPYEYAYYNAFAGGTRGAFRQYETEYWLTCYKEAVEQGEKMAKSGQVLYVFREPYIAAYYAGPNLIVRGPDDGDPQPGDWMLFSTRANNDQRSSYRKAPILFSVGRQGAEFCIVKGNGK
jgi:hypothetical protein